MQASSVAAGRGNGSGSPTVRTKRGHRTSKSSVPKRSTLRERTQLAADLYRRGNTNTPTAKNLRSRSPKRSGGASSGAGASAGTGAGRGFGFRSAGRSASPKQRQRRRGKAAKSTAKQANSGGIGIGSGSGSSSKRRPGHQRYASDSKVDGHLRSRKRQPQEASPGFLEQLQVWYRYGVQHDMMAMWISVLPFKLVPIGYGMGLSNLRFAGHSKSTLFCCCCFVLLLTFSA